MAEHINIKLFDGYLKYYMNVPDPKALSDEDWAEELQILHYIRTNEKESSQLPT